jgi:hypothetical protein
VHKWLNAIVGTEERVDQLQADEAAENIHVELSARLRTVVSPAKANILEFRLSGTERTAQASLREVKDSSIKTKETNCRAHIGR